MLWLLAELILGLFLFLPLSVLSAAGPGVSGGLSLLEAPSARPAALGQAYTAATDDISAFAYNPASLKTLQSGQTSLLYVKGMNEDSFAQFLIGRPLGQGAVGLALGYYDGGDFEFVEVESPGGPLVDRGTVRAQRDMMASLGYARSLGVVSMGVAAKFLSSELIQEEKATAYAADVGLSIPLHPRVNFGMALQNMGSKLTFVDEGDPLPRIARAGFTVGVLGKPAVTTLLVDAPYFLNEKEIRPAFGVESLIGPVALRFGYKTKNELNAITTGVGFAIDRWSVDYAFGLVQDLDSTHKVSFSMRWGGISEPQLGGIHDSPHLERVPGVPSWTPKSQPPTQIIQEPPKSAPKSKAIKKPKPVQKPKSKKRPKRRLR